MISAALMPHLSAGTKQKAAIATLARALTLARFAGVGPFVWLLVRVYQGAPPSERAMLGCAYLFLALSDFFDGRLARRAGAATADWARADVGADVFFNVCSLGAAAWLRLVGPWVPAGVALLGGRFLARSVRDGGSDGDLPEDRLGKLAGVAYYALVGWIVAELVLGGILGRIAIARGGDAVFLYTLVAFWRGRERPMSSRRRRTKRST
ncbi:MAG TPA: CDP-alcohol phosphatidyltransferase family protein [Candidatus Binatia bacterium]|nr:CDP-alcohol phosphatidyltransferase family protein [Candidatus Binatia bacterium]